MLNLKLKYVINIYLRIIQQFIIKFRKIWKFNNVEKQNPDIV